MSIRPTFSLIPFLADLFKAKERLFRADMPSYHPSEIYRGRSGIFKSNLRKVKKAQMRRAYLRSLKG